MAGINLPPQAYTAEMLARAYEWLKGQPPSIRELATSADTLVGLYMRAKRARKNHHNAPVSSKEFSADLKNLAKNLQDFDSGKKLQRPTITLTAVNPNTDPAPTQENSKASAPTQTPPGSSESSCKESRTDEEEQKSSEAESPSATITLPSGQQLDAPRVDRSPQTMHAALDRRTRMMLDKVAQRLNLSSPHEALRVLVVLGYERVKEILPPS